MNPLYNQQNKQQFPNMAQIKRVLMSQDDSFYQKMMQMARQKGISEESIKEGMKFIDALRH